MADFYMLSYISTINFDALLRPSLQNPNGLASAIRGDKYKDDIIYAKEKLFPELKKQILDDTFFAIVSEARHSFEALSTLKKWQIVGSIYDPSREGKPIPDLELKVNKIPSWYLKLAKYYYNFLSSTDTTESDKFENYERAFNIVNNWLTENKITRGQFVEATKNVFSIWSLWEDQYGGEAWVNISNGWLGLYNAGNDLNKQAVYIDHLYDLEHNTGSVFNKIKRYMDPETFGFGWLSDFLDYKAAVRNPYELLLRTSDSMKKLASPVLHAAGFSRKDLNPNEIYLVNVAKGVGYGAFESGWIEEKWVNAQGKLNRGNDLPAKINRKVDDKNFIPGESQGSAAWYKNGVIGGGRTAEEISYVSVHGNIKDEHYGNEITRGEYSAKHGKALYRRKYKKVGSEWKMTHEYYFIKGQGGKPDKWYDAIKQKERIKI